jgi:hypothetical protein
MESQVEHHDDDEKIAKEFIPNVHLRVYLSSYSRLEVFDVG